MPVFLAAKTFTSEAIRKRSENDTKRGCALTVYYLSRGVSPFMKDRQER